MPSFSHKQQQERLGALRSAAEGLRGQVTALALHAHSLVVAIESVARAPRLKPLSDAAVLRLGKARCALMEAERETVSATWALVGGDDDDG